MIITIAATTIVALVAGVAGVPDSISASVSFETFGGFDLGNSFVELGFLSALLAIFTLMLADFFDTMGTATAIVEQAGLTDEKGGIGRLRSLLLVDSLGAALGGVAGVSSNTSYIESSAGVAEGGKTGLTSVVTGILFLIAIVLSPLAGIVPAQATAPVLILIGFLMVGLLKHIDLHGPGGRAAGPAGHHSHAIDLLDHSRDRRRIRDPHADQGGQGQVGRDPHPDVGRLGRQPGLLRQRLDRDVPLTHPLT